jgi:hypothetical protein
VNFAASSKRVVVVALEYEVRKEFCRVHIHQMFPYEWMASISDRSTRKF